MAHRLYSRFRAPALGQALFISLLAAAIGLLIAFAGKPAEKDYISYWSAGQQLAHHADPYSIPQVLALEKTQGYTLDRPLVMRNPPWALFVTLPLGHLSARGGLILWTYMTVACVAAGIALFGIRTRDRALVFCFAPVFGSLAAGQSSPFLLLGVAVFLACYQKRPATAGIGLLFMAFKPHLFFLVWPLLVVDCLLKRRFRMLAGFAAALAVASAFALWLDPHVWPQYLAFAKHAGIQSEFVPTPSSIVRLLTDRSAGWGQWLPSAIALFWAARFYFLRRSWWDWSQHAVPLLLVGLWASPYAWVTDEIVLLPVVAWVLLRGRSPRYSVPLLLLANGVLLVLFAAGVQPTTGAYLWTTTAWLACYLYTRSGLVAERKSAVSGQLPALVPAQAL